VFFAEMLLKIYALGLNGYFKDRYNVFDFVIVMFSLLDIGISTHATYNSHNDQVSEESPAILKALRALRLLRSIKLMRSWGAMQDLINKAAQSLSDIFLFSILLALLMFILSLLGMEVFAKYCYFTQDGELVTDVVKANEEGVMMQPPRENFENIFNAFTTVFILIIGEMWPNIMMNYTRVYTAGSFAGGFTTLYFVICIMLGNLVMLSLFTSILLDNFENPEGAEKAVKN